MHAFDLQSSNVPGNGDLNVTVKMFLRAYIPWLVVCGYNAVQSMDIQMTRDTTPPLRMLRLEFEWCQQWNIRELSQKWKIVMVHVVDGKIESNRCVCLVIASANCVC